MVAAAAATGILSLCGGTAFADSQAEGAAQGSPGVVSGNDIQAPVHVPVNVCGNTLDVIAALNPAFGNECANVSQHKDSGKPDRGSPGAPGGHHDSGHGGSGHGGSGHHDSGHGGSGHGPGGHSGHGGSGHDGYGPGGDEGYGPGGGASADGYTEGSPGVGSGNNAQLPVDLPVNACGNSVNVIGLLNPVFGNSCANEEPP
ncbi:chaplin, partial [Streptomyces sp. H28]|nr:chaplin [Streptomyces sp. H28]